ncbi:MAG: hypothetical protein IJ334_05995 [Clostridia bacterium]|nr:hypothetical protein [Clostridia bacterium]
MKKLGTMDLILLLLGVFLALFTTAMTVIHCITGSTPDTLITCVFGICGVEGGVMGWIKTAKMKKLNGNCKNSNCTSNNFRNNSNCSSDFCENDEEITEIMEVNHELEEETYE